MAKQRNKPKQVKKNRILASATSIGKAPQEKDRKDQIITDWVLYYGESNNIFPNDLAKKILKSGTNSGIINSKKTLTVGNGLKYTQDGEDYEPNDNENEYLEEINADGLSLEELYEKCALDWIAFGATYIEGVRKDNQVFYFHKDITQIRVGLKKNGKQLVYLSPDWEDIKNSRHLSGYQKERMKTIEMYDGTDTQKNFIIRITRDFPGLSYYGTPDYVAAVISGWVDINYRIGKFNIMFGQEPEGMTAKEYVESIRDNFTGEGKNGKMIFQLLDSPEQAANIQILDRVQQGHFEILDGMADQQLITAHGWYRSLTGLAESGSLGNSQQIRNEFDLAMNMKVTPDYRRPLNRFFNKLLQLAGFDFQVGVRNLTPISLINDLDVNKCLTINEGRRLLGFDEIEGERGEELIDLEDREDVTTSNGNIE
jgi:hypothetical protein